MSFFIVHTDIITAKIDHIRVSLFRYLPIHSRPAVKDRIPGLLRKVDLVSFARFDQRDIQQYFRVGIILKPFDIPVLLRIIRLREHRFQTLQDADVLRRLGSFFICLRFFLGCHDAEDRIESMLLLFQGEIPEFFIDIRIISDGPVGEGYRNTVNAGSGILIPIKDTGLDVPDHLIHFLITADQVLIIRLFHDGKKIDQIHLEIAVKRVGIVSGRGNTGIGCGILFDRFPDIRKQAAESVISRHDQCRVHQGQGCHGIDFSLFPLQDRIQLVIAG